MFTKKISKLVCLTEANTHIIIETIEVVINELIV